MIASSATVIETAPRTFFGARPERTTWEMGNLEQRRWAEPDSTKGYPAINNKRSDVELIETYRNVSV